jgi:UDPglucose 6-dehydrogenase
MALLVKCHLLNSISFYDFIVSLETKEVFMKISVVGTGYVGLVAGVCFADAGHDVTCVDRDEAKIKMLLEKKVPIYEPGLEELLAQAIRKNKIQFTTDIAKSVKENDVVFVAVGTPEKEDGNADMGPTFAVLKSICESANTKKYVVLKSTVPIGTNKDVKKYFEDNCKHPVEVINNPEFLKEGAAIDDFLKPDRVVIGCATETAQKVMQELYDPFVKNGHPIIFMDNTSAEMTKYAANSFLSVKISFINEMARLADAVGADIDAVRKGFTSDKRISPAFFYPGIGFGGSCFPKDVQALIQSGKNNNVATRIVNSALEVNDLQRYYLVELAQKHFGNLKGKKIAMWGLSFKPKTDDVREAPAMYMIQKLNELGAQVVAYDPVAGENAKKYFDTNFDLATDPMEMLKGADALFIVTEWNEFRNPQLNAIKEYLKTPTVFDGRNVLNPSKMKEMGFNYFCIGRQAVR